MSGFGPAVGMFRNVGSLVLYSRMFWESNKIIRASLGTCVGFMQSLYGPLCREFLRESRRGGSLCGDSGLGFISWALLLY